MRLADLLVHLGSAQVLGPVDRPIRRVTHDSRLAGSEDVFVAIRGAKVDGRDYARGLDVTAVIADAPVVTRPGVTVVLVSDARRALALASAAVAGFPGASMPVVGITGTNGKTTVSWMIEAIGLAAGLSVGVIGTTGFRFAGQREPAAFTTPEAPVLQDLLARMRDAGCGLVAMEVSSIGLSLRRVDGIPFRVGVFTSFSQDHLDFHGTMEAYLQAKARLFRELLAPGAVAVLNSDDPASAEVCPREIRRIRYGLGEGVDLSAKILETSLDGTLALVRWEDLEGDMLVRIPGEHNVSNALAAVGAGLSLGVSLEDCLMGIAGLHRVPGRLDPVPTGRDFKIFVDFAHTPAALERVLALLRPLTPGRLITVFGCGGDRDRSKRPRMGLAAGEGSDMVVLTSDNPRSEDPQGIINDVLRGLDGPHVVQPDRALAIAEALASAGPGDCVLIAGKGHEATQIIGDRVLPFDDREVALAWLRGGAA